LESDAVAVEAIAFAVMDAAVAMEALALDETPRVGN
jgi:hypothetical protein